MLILDEPPLIFFHVRKTAGMSVLNALAPKPRTPHPLCLPAAYPHETVSEFVDRVGLDVFRSHQSFGFVRHPFDRFVSQYRFMQGRREKIPFMQSVNSVSEFIDAIKANVQLRVLLRKGEKVEGMATLTRPQHEYVSLGDRPIAVSHLFRFEDIPGKWGTICRKLGLTERPLEALNSSDPTVSIDDPALARRFVGDYYRRDFELFGY